MNTQINNFWKNQIKILSWNKIPKKIFNEKKKNYFEWFADGKLNLTFNCIQKNIDLGFGKKIAIYFYDKDFNKKSYTYKDLSELIDKFIYIINKRINRSKKNVILIHGSASIETTIAILSCAKLGIHFSVIFEDLPKKAIDLRIKILKPTLIITRFDINKCRKTFSFSNLLIFSNSKKKNKKIYQISVNKLKKTKMKKIDYSFFYSNKTLFTLFTSGSTGEPKGIQHSTGGYLLYSKYTCMNQFGMNKDSVVLTASDAGWINGHTYALFGPLSIGSTTVLCEKPLMLLNSSFLKKILNDLRISILYLPVTLAKLIKATNNIKSKSKYIKSVGSMGEPLSPSLNYWLSSKFSFKRIPIVNTYFQTETGGIIFSPRYDQEYSKVSLGSVGKPSCKYFKIFNPYKNKKFEIILQNNWPGCMINVVNGHKVWNNYWYKKKFKMFDIGSFKNGDLLIHGRNDDVINIRGHRIGSEEIESVLMNEKDIIEVSAIAIPDIIEGSKIIVFFSINDHNLRKIEIIKTKINQKLSDHFGSFAIPKRSICLEILPKTRSGKILRRLLRDLYKNPYEKSIGDLSTMINIEKLKKIREEINEQKR